MTNEMKVPGIYRAFYRKALADVRERFAAYEQEVRDWYESGDGAPAEWVEASTQPWFDPEFNDPDRKVNIGGRGYRFPHCIHGTSLWTDYDNICGGCEDSESEYDIARGVAREAWLRFCDRWDWFQSAPGDLQYQQPEAYAAIRDWTFNQYLNNVPKS